MSEAWIDHEFFDDWTEPFELDGCRIVMTCSACPEQYDVTLDGAQLGYLRLRSGHFYASYPDVCGQIVYEHQFDDSLMGCFSPDERKIHLPAAVKALLKRHRENENN
jgi:hypothetical protein